MDAHRQVLAARETRYRNKSGEILLQSPFRAQALTEFDEVDYAIEAATFALALPEIVAIERLIGSAQKRLLSLLDNLEKPQAT